MIDYIAMLIIVPPSLFTFFSLLKACPGHIIFTITRTYSYASYVLSLVFSFPRKDRFKKKATHALNG